MEMDTSFNFSLQRKGGRGVFQNSQFFGLKINFIYGGIPPLRTDSSSMFLTPSHMIIVMMMAMIMMMMMMMMTMTTIFRRRRKRRSKAQNQWQTMIDQTLGDKTKH